MKRKREETCEATEDKANENSNHEHENINLQTNPDNRILGPAFCRSFHTPSRLIITGRSGIGKTSLAVPLICEHIMPRVRRCYAVCPTWYEQQQLSPLRDIPGAFPRRRVFTSVSDDIFDLIFDKCRKKPAPTLLYVDDASAESSTNKGNKGSFSRLCVASPHLSLYIVGVFHGLSTISPQFRTNAEGLISFVSSRAKDVDKIVDEFNPAPSMPESRQWIRKSLVYSWNNHRFAYITREKVTGEMHVYAGSGHELPIPDFSHQ